MYDVCIIIIIFWTQYQYYYFIIIIFYNFYAIRCKEPRAKIKIIIIIHVCMYSVHCSCWFLIRMDILPVVNDALAVLKGFMAIYTKDEHTIWSIYCYKIFSIV